MKPLRILDAQGNNVSDSRVVTIEQRRSLPPVAVGLKTGERIMQGEATVFVQPPPVAAIARF